MMRRNKESLLPDFARCLQVTDCLQKEEGYAPSAKMMNMR